MRQASTTNFSGQDVYVGIDTHKRSWAVCVVGDGWEKRPFSQDPRTERLVEHLHVHFPGGRYHLAYEAGFAGNWIAREFARQGIDCIIVNAADVPTNDKDRRRKTDARDCQKIARSLRSHELNALYVPTQQAEEDRQLLRTRLALVRKQTRTKNQIKSMLAIQGIELPAHSELSHWSGAFIKWLHGLLNDRPVLKQSLDTYLLELEWQRSRLAVVLRQIRELSRSERFATNVNLLLSVPGVGLLSAMTFLSEIIDIRRFHNLDDLAGYIGLVPDTHSSGDLNRTTGITSRANNHVRQMIIECSWVAVRKDPALTRRFERDVHRMVPSRAIIRIARKLLSRIHHVLREQEPYRLDVSTTSGVDHS